MATDGVGRRPHLPRRLRRTPTRQGPVRWQDRQGRRGQDPHRQRQRQGHRRRRLTPLAHARHRVTAGDELKRAAVGMPQRDAGVTGPADLRHRRPAARKHDCLGERLLALRAVV